MKKLNPILKKILRSILLAIPFAKTKVRHYDRLNQIMYNSGYVPGHYYSPIPNIAEVERDADRIFADKDLVGINLNTEDQIKLLEKFKTYYPDYP